MPELVSGGGSTSDSIIFGHNEERRELSPSFIIFNNLEFDNN